MKACFPKLTVAAVLLALLSTLNLPLSTAHAQGTAFTYQGQLQNNSGLASGTYNLQFSLYTASSGGTLVAGPVTNSAVVVTGGLFTVVIDFGGGVWCGATNWLQIGVRTNGNGAFTALNPRQQVTPVPIAITAENLCGTVPGGGLSGTYVNQVTLNNGGNQFSGGFNGSFTGNGGGLTNLNVTTLGGLPPGDFWQLFGNTVTNGNFLGSVNNQPLELRANGARALLLEPAAPSPTLGNGVPTGAPNVIGGSPANYVQAAVGATIGGGGATNYNGYLYIGNIVLADFGTVAGGAGNIVSGTGSFIGAGLGNNIGFADYGVIGGGSNNFISFGNEGTVGGGFGNAISGGNFGVIGGGWANGNLATSSTIGGGYLNSILSGANDATIAGGQGNLIDTNSASTIVNNFKFYSGAWANVGGGFGNTIQSAGSVIGGGFYNLIDTNSTNAIIFPDGQQNKGGWSTVAGGAQNTISAGTSFIGGGGFNWIQPTAQWSLIGGGEGNLIDSNSFTSTLYTYGIIENNISGGFSTIGGGVANKIRTDTSVIDGGAGNRIDLSSSSSSIGGGIQNTISNASYSVIAGGDGSSIIGGGPSVSGGGGSSVIGGGGANKILAVSGGGFIGGGSGNTIDTNGASAAIAGGSNNRANGPDATVPGGLDNLASGQDSFAAGKFASATNDFSFVWGGNVNAGTAHSSGPDQFLIFSSGVGINNSNPTNATLAVNGTIEASANITADNYLLAGVSLYANLDGHFGGNLYVGAPGLNGNGTFYGGITCVTLNQTSDRNVKEHFIAANPQEVLAKVAALPITFWNFTNAPALQHLGPMAQDFHAAFGLNGDDDKHISITDEGGVALAAIQGLNQKVEEQNKQKDAEIKELKQENQSLAERLTVLEQIILKQKPN